MNAFYEDVALPEDLRQKGYVQAQCYTWSQAASKILAVYQQLYEGATTFSDVPNLVADTSLL
jgi:hypothetical protein